MVYFLTIYIYTHMSTHIDSFNRGLVFLSICLAVGILFVSNAQAALDTGTLIKTADNSAVYYVAEDSKRYVFPNEKIYNSWKDVLGDISIVSASELASYKIGGNVTYRPGTRLVKITSDPTVYFVGYDGALYAIANEETARFHYGDNWAQHVDDIPDGFFVNYTVSNNELKLDAGISATFKDEVKAIYTSINKLLASKPQKLEKHG